MKLVITKRGQKRIASNREYLEDYRVKKHVIEILSVRHCLMRIDTPRQL